ncbi:MAG: hypothetical protein WA239_03675 [Candidatus Sulfotelmatobacter sp.]
MTIRIAKDFYDFLLKFGESPDAHQIDYMMGTIRSGIDEFALLAYACRGIEGSRWTKSLDAHAPWDFPALRESFIRDFDHLGGQDVSVLDRLDSLFSLTRLELVFLARHFPSAIFEEGLDEPKTVAEAKSELSDVLADISEVRGGRLSAAEASARAQARRTKRSS